MSDTGNESKLCRIGLDVSALDPSFKEHAGRGIGRYVTELNRYFESRSAGELAERGLALERFSHRELMGRSLMDRAIDLLPAGRHTARQQVLYPARLVRGVPGRCDALHFPAHMDAPSWAFNRCVVTLLDLIPVVCAELYKAERPGWRFHLARFLEHRAIRRATLVLAISEQTAKDAERLLGIPPERIRVTPLAVGERLLRDSRRDVSPDEESELRRELSLAESSPVVLYVGGIDPRKNIVTMLRAFRMLVDARRDRGDELPVLVMAGRIDRDREYPKVLDTINSMELAAHVRLPGFLPDERLRVLYKISHAFCFPSLYEGFGMPPLEALAHGVPVASSKTSCMPHILEDAAIYFDPESKEDVSGALLRLLEDSTLRRQLSERGPIQAAKFTWRATGEKTLDAYSEVARLLATQPLPPTSRNLASRAV